MGKSVRECTREWQRELAELGLYFGNIDGRFGIGSLSASREAINTDKQQSDDNTQEESVSIPGTAHFSLSEYHCNDGTPVPEEYYSNVQKSMDRLEELRAVLSGLPITITSGYRTPEYNELKGGAENSAHLRGTATDITVSDKTPLEVYNKADELFPEAGIGLYDWGVHIDFDDEVERPKRW